MLIFFNFPTLLNFDSIYSSKLSSGYLIGNMPIRHHGREAFHGAGFGRVND